MRPLFSIITPAFNCADKIGGTVKSVFRQETGSWEYLVVDGASTDGTTERLRDLAVQVPGSGAMRWVSEPDQGIYDAMNKGVALTQGQFIYFLGAGDQLRPGVLREVAERAGLLAGQASASGGARFLYGDVWWLGRDVLYDGEFTVGDLCERNICQQAIFYERSLFTRHGTFDARYRFCADHAFNFRCFADRTVEKRYLPNLVVADYEGAGGSTENSDPAFQRDYPSLIRRHFGTYYLFRHQLRVGWLHWLGFLRRRRQQLRKLL